MKLVEHGSDAVAKALKPSVLVVDDSLDSLYLQKMILEMDGYRVLTAASGDDAFVFIEKRSEIDLVLLDVQMAGMSGIDFFNAISKSHPEFIKRVPIVFLTGMDEVPNIGAAGFIRKPIDISTFTKIVAKFLKQASSGGAIASD